MKLNIKNMVRIALYTAIFVVLSLYGTINLKGLKITIQNLPIYVAAITGGVVPGALVGFIGMFLNQMLTYGFQATTLFWVLPQTILGVACGYIFENEIIKLNNKKKFFVTIIVLQIMVTLLNTIVLLIDSIVYGYYNILVIFGLLIIRIMLSILTGIVFCFIITFIVDLTKKYIDPMIKS